MALLGCFAEGETIVRGAQELRLKETDRIATVVDGLGRARRDHRGHRGRLRGHRHRAACAAGASPRTATTAWRCSAPIAGLASREGVEVDGMEAADVSYPRFMDDVARLM